jgi:hypothetical protein
VENRTLWENIQYNRKILRNPTTQRTNEKKWYDNKLETSLFDLFKESSIVVVVKGRKAAQQYVPVPTTPSGGNI